MFLINNYTLLKQSSDLYLITYGKGIKIANPKLGNILCILKQQDKLEISESSLMELAQQFSIEYQELKKFLVEKLGVLKALAARKFQIIYINSDNEHIASSLKQTLKAEYTVEILDPSQMIFKQKSLVLFYRNNYSHEDFKKLYSVLSDQIYIVTSGIVHNILVIDNIYYKNSGLPSHFSNFNNLLASVQNGLSVTKNNWLLFYRSFLKNQSEHFPDPEINQCQQGYISYCLYQFLSQFTNFWKPPTTLDEFNWFWHVDLNGLNVFKEVAVHSPYSEHDMNLNFEYDEVACVSA